MPVKCLKDEKNEAEIEFDNLTIAEILRAYLSQDDSVEFVAWRREHPYKNIILKVKTSGKTVKKALADASDKIEKELDKVVSEFKKTR